MRGDNSDAAVHQRRSDGRRDPDPAPPDRRPRCRPFAPLAVVVAVALPSLWLPPVVASAAPPSPPLRLPDDGDIRTLDGHVDVWLDASHSADLTGVLARRAQFEPVGPRAYGKPPVDATVWLRVTLHNPGDTVARTVLELNFALIDEVEAFVLDGDRLLHRWRAGEATPRQERVIPHMFPRFPLTVAPGQRLTVFLRLVDEGALPAPLRVAGLPALERAENQRSVEVGLFLGMLLLVLCYALYLLARFRQPLYGWLALTLAAFCVFHGFAVWGGAGYLFEHFDSRPWWVNRLITMAGVGAIASLVMFGVHLLRLDALSPRWARALRIQCAALAALIVAVLALPYLWSLLLVYLLVAPILSLLFVALTRTLEGDRIARTFMWATAAVTLGAILSIARTSGLIPHNFLTENTSTFGFALMVLLLSVAVADRMAETERARRLALQAQLEEARRNAALSSTFEQFVPHEFLERLQRDDLTEIRLGDRVEKEMTVLFSDIRGFTSIAEGMTPDQNLTFVNEFLSHMEPAIHGERGFIDKYIGDAVMALFDEDTRPEGDYLPETTGRAGAEHSVAAAIAMHRALETYNLARAARGDPPVQIGVGLHTGHVMLGMVGGRERLSASVIGDAVNLAARVEGLTKRYGAKVLLTGGTVASLPQKHAFTLRPVDRVRVKGKAEAVELFELLDAEAPASRQAKERTAEPFEAAWRAMQAGDIAAAESGFATCLQTAPDDKVAALHLARCRDLLRDGVPEGWDGVTTMDSK